MGAIFQRSQPVGTCTIFMSGLHGVGKMEVMDALEPTRAGTDSYPRFRDRDFGIENRYFVFNNKTHVSLHSVSLGLPNQDNHTIQGYIRHVDGGLIFVVDAQNPRFSKAQEQLSWLLSLPQTRALPLLVLVSNTDETTPDADHFATELELSTERIRPWRVEFFSKTDISGIVLGVSFLIDVRYGKKFYCSRICVGDHIIDDDGNPGVVESIPKHRRSIDVQFSHYGVTLSHFESIRMTPTKMWIFPYLEIFDGLTQRTIVEFLDGGKNVVNGKIEVVEQLYESETLRHYENVNLLQF